MHEAEAGGDQKSEFSHAVNARGGSDIRRMHAHRQEGLDFRPREVYGVTSTAALRIQPQQPVKQVVGLVQAGRT